MDGQYRGPVPSIWPEYMGARCSFFGSDRALSHGIRDMASNLGCINPSRQSKGGRGIVPGLNPRAAQLRFSRRDGRCPRFEPPEREPLVQVFQIARDGLSPTRPAGSLFANMDRHAGGARGEHHPAGRGFHHPQNHGAGYPASAFSPLTASPHSVREYRDWLRGQCSSCAAKVDPLSAGPRTAGPFVCSAHGTEFAPVDDPPHDPVQCIDPTRWPQPSDGGITGYFLMVAAL